VADRGGHVEQLARLTRHSAFGVVHEDRLVEERYLGPRPRESSEHFLRREVAGISSCRIRIGEEYEWLDPQTQQMLFAARP
jgi:hypothetical protein